MGMTKKICGNCVEFSFNKYSTSNFDDRHFCNLAIRNGDFEDSICLRLPTESCENWKGDVE